jgi:hypothetical protein
VTRTKEGNRKGKEIFFSWLKLFIKIKTQQAIFFLNVISGRGVHCDAAAPRSGDILSDQWQMICRIISPALPH